MTPREEEKLSVAEAARHAGMTIEGIRDAIRRGKLKAEVIATRPIYAIQQSDLAAYLQEADKDRPYPLISRGYWPREPKLVPAKAA